MFLLISKNHPQVFSRGYSHFEHEDFDSIYQTFPLFTGQSITLGGFAASVYKARETGEAFRTLNKTMLIELVYPTTNVIIPAVSDLKKSPKLFWLDAELVNSVSGIQKGYLLYKDLMDTWRGKLQGILLLRSLKRCVLRLVFNVITGYGKKRGSKAEVDFIVIHDGKIGPI